MVKKYAISIFYRNNKLRKSRKILNFQLPLITKKQFRVQNELKLRRNFRN